MFGTKKEGLRCHRCVSYKRSGFKNAPFQSMVSSMVARRKKNGKRRGKEWENY